MGKGENAGLYNHFLLFKQCFQKASSSSGVKSCHCDIGLKTLIQTKQVPVARVPSILLSYTLAVLSEQPTASCHGNNGLAAMDVTALLLLIKTSLNEQRISE